MSDTTAKECLKHDPDLMFPEDEDPTIDAAGRKTDNPEVAEAKAVCRRCPFRQECLDGAVARREPYGVWGGLTTNERNAMIRRHYRAPRQDEMLEVAV